MGGRPRKPTAKHQQEGTYRKDRHAGRADAITRPGLPEKPLDLPERCSDLWDLVVDNLPADVLSPLDGPALEAYVKAVEIRDKMIEHGDYKEARGWDVRVAYWQSRLGLNPVDRAKIDVKPPEKDDTNPFKLLAAAAQKRESA